MNEILHAATQLTHVLSSDKNQAISNIKLAQQQALKQLAEIVNNKCHKQICAKPAAFHNIATYTKPTISIQCVSSEGG